MGRAIALSLGLAVALAAAPAALRAQAAAAGGDAAAPAGEVRPGMSLAEVRRAWGEPLAVRSLGKYSYAFFANDCAPACGMNDVVILEQDQVIDAVVRDSRRRYAGVSSSPTGRTPSPSDVDTTTPAPETP